MKETNSNGRARFPGARVNRPEYVISPTIVAPDSSRGFEHHTKFVWAYGVVRFQYINPYEIRTYLRSSLGVRTNTTP